MFEKGRLLASFQVNHRGRLLMVGACLAASSAAMPAQAQDAGKPVAAQAATAQTVTNSQQDTTVMVGGEVYTPAGWSTAIAFRDGRIIALGSDAQVRAQSGPNAKVIELQGKTVFPGLYDMHVHPHSAGTLMVQCRFEQGAAPQTIVDKIADCVRGKKLGEWIAGGQWQAISFGATPPTRQMLDRVSPDNPVILKDVSGHSIWVNSLALKLAGVTRDTQPPEAGIIERDANGEPTGVLREAAMALVRKAVTPLSLEDNAAAIERALTTLISYGVTTATDAGVTQDIADAYKYLSDNGRLVPHVRACFIYGKLWTGSGSFEALFANRERYRLPHLTPDCVKFIVDGVPTESHTAAMVDPYVDQGHGVLSPDGDRGTLQVPPEELDPMVTRIDKLGLVGKFHAVGDEASNAVLDAVALARKANGTNGPRHDIAHVTFITKPNLARAKALGVALEFSPYLWFPTAINDDIIKAVGKERVERIWPVREAIDADDHVDIGSDWPSGTPTASPWVAMETLVTRRAPDSVRGDEVLGPAEAITLKEAVTMFTVGGAQQMGNFDKSGTIEVGKVADIIVLDRNPFRIPITDVHKVRIEQTIIDGVTVFDATK